VLQALRHAESYLRHALVESLDLPFVPMLSFHIDNANQRGQRIDALLNILSRGTGAPGELPATEDED
jgi:ribosome-binding factor A